MLSRGKPFLDVVIKHRIPLTSRSLLYDMHARVPMYINLVLRVPIYARGESIIQIGYSLLQRFML